MLTVLNCFSSSEIAKKHKKFWAGEVALSVEIVVMATTKGDD